MCSAKNNDMIQKSLVCIYCDTKFSVELFPNFSVICPCCKRHVFLECEYGYGPITPFRIYLGTDIAGTVITEKNNYFLKMDKDRIALEKTYLDAILEAEEIVKKSLGISCKRESTGIITKGGSLSFYGHWFGRPYDNYYKIVQTSFDGTLLEIIFKDGERLLVYNPKDIISTEKKLKIRQAEKIKWVYFSYGAKERNIIEYKLVHNKICKSSKYGMEYITADLSMAISME